MFDFISKIVYYAKKPDKNPNLPHKIESLPLYFCYLPAKRHFIMARKSDTDIVKLKSSFKWPENTKAYLRNCDGVYAHGLDTVLLTLIVERFYIFLFGLILQTIVHSCIIIVLVFCRFDSYVICGGFAVCSVDFIRCGFDFLNKIKLCRDCLKLNKGCLHKSLSLHLHKCNKKHCIEIIDKLDQLNLSKDFISLLED